MWRIPMAALAMIALAGCETEFQTVAAEVSTTARSLGAARGTSHRHLLFMTPTYNILPIAWGGCVSRAHDEAVASVPGATALAGVTFEEDWFWWGLGSTREQVITGTGVAR